jgi:hypothetical protein
MLSLRQVAKDNQSVVALSRLRLRILLELSLGEHLIPLL